MFRSTTIYTVHENPDRDEPSERMILVREGFSFWAFLLGLLWLLANRLWIPAILYVLFIVALMEGGARLGMGETMLSVWQVGSQVLLGLLAHDLQRWQLARRGYALRDVVVGESELLAERRAYDRQRMA